MKLWLQDNSIEIQLTVVAERFIRFLMSKIYKHMIAVSKNVHKHKLCQIVDKYNNKYHRNIKLKVIDSKSNTYINFEVENNKKDPNFKVGGNMTISK